jgi:hypothetical protein
MRWDNLFDDLESQLEQELGAEDIDLLAEEERLRLGRLSLRDRLRAMSAAEQTIGLILADGTRVAITVGAFGRDWIAGEFLGEGHRAAPCVIPISAIAGCLPTHAQTAASVDGDPDTGLGSLASRLGLPFVLRDLCRRRAAVDIRTARELLHGTIDRVGRDHFDLAEHEPGVPRRDRSVRAIRLVPIADLVHLRF